MDSYNNPAEDNPRLILREGSNGFIFADLLPGKLAGRFVKDIYPEITALITAFEKTHACQYCHPEWGNIPSGLVFRRL